MWEKGTACWTELVRFARSISRLRWYVFIKKEAKIIVQAICKKCILQQNKFRIVRVPSWNNLFWSLNFCVVEIGDQTLISINYSFSISYDVTMTLPLQAGEQLSLMKGLPPLRKFAPPPVGGGGCKKFLTGVHIVPKIANFLKNLKNMPPQ